MGKDINKNRTKNVLRNICISTIILFLGMIMIVKSFNIEQQKQDILYSYNINRNLNYTVNLNDNKFFENNMLDMDKTYISSLVDKINMDFTYSLSGNKKAKTKYTYQIVAVTDVKYANVNPENSNQSIWEKQHVLVEPKQLSVDDSHFTINEKFDVDYAKYNNEVKEFKDELKLPITADLQIKLIVKTDMDVQGLDDIIIDSSIMNLKMDLAQDIFTVEKQFENTENKSVTKTTEMKKDINIVLISVGSALVVIAILIMLDSIRKSIKYNKKSDYAIALNRILKNYGDIVAEIVSPVEIDNLNVIEVKDFDQLLDIEEEIRMPILFYETIPDEQGEFIIVCDNMAYRYVIG